MIAFRSLAFNTVFYVNLALFLVLGSGFLLAPRKLAVRALQAWACSSLWWMQVLAGTRIEVRGREHIPQGACLVAGKHQSAWETFAILPYLDDPAMVVKKELTFIPFYGWFMHKFRMIGVERSEGSKALRNLIVRAKQEIARGRQVVIMPEGTRRAPGDPPDYKPGAAALYGALGVACVPFALNSGLYWPRRKFLRYPGTIILEFLLPIPPGLPRKQFQARLEDQVETATAQLVLEGKAELSGYK